MRREGQTKPERPEEDSARASIIIQREVKIVKETIAATSIQTSISKDSDDGMNDKLFRETKRPKE